MSNSELPTHVAIIMDGNGRWAQQRGKPRPSGHRAGVKSTRAIIEETFDLGIEVLTLFAFSSENWSRPPVEVNLLMDLFLRTLSKDMQELHEKGIRVRFLGEHTRFPKNLQEHMRKSEALTANNTNGLLQIAVGYGGQGDVVQAAQNLAQQVKAGTLEPTQITTDVFEQALYTHSAPPVDLMIRTGGEWRISNFLLWQAAYAELYFTDCLWPDFDTAALKQALSWFKNRERRYGGVLGEAHA